MPEKKWKEWPINKKRMLLTKRSPMPVTKPLRRPRKLPVELVPVLPLTLLSRKLRMLPRP